MNHTAVLPVLGDQTRAIMKKGSKTFSFAALLFDGKTREGAELLYTWCRACDDAVDNEPNQALALGKLRDLREKTALAFRVSQNQTQDSSENLYNDITFKAFSRLNQRYGIAEEHAQALLDGMQMDVEGAHIPDDETLKLYCYRVAGVVGLMMSKVMGITDPRAHQHAIDTGLAMQMTNIARDIREDFDRNRTYIPGKWFSTSNSKINSSCEFDSVAMALVAKKLVEQAEQLYKSGEAGLKYLPLRAALAVGCAQTIYREIGRKVVTRGCHAWDARTIVSGSRKVSLALTTITKILFSRLF